MVEWDAGVRSKAGVVCALGCRARMNTGEEGRKEEGGRGGEEKKIAGWQLSGRRSGVARSSTSSGAGAVVGDLKARHCRATRLPQPTSRGGRKHAGRSEMRRTARGAQHGSAHFSGQHGGSTARAARRSIHQSSSPLN